MSPRPRQASDEDILKAAFRAISRLGPARMTLADVAEEAGVSAAALVQRFGSKRALLLAAAADAATGGDYIFPSLRAKHRSPLAALAGMAECMAMMGTTPEAIANTLAFLQIDLTDPDFHRHALRSSEGTHAGIRDLVRDAIRAGELMRCDAGRLASALQATMNGSLLNWAIHRDGELQTWIRRDLKTVLDPYVIKRASSWPASARGDRTEAAARAPAARREAPERRRSLPAEARSAARERRRGLPAEARHETRGEGGPAEARPDTRGDGGPADARTDTVTAVPASKKVR
jgi:AcrR family transcriptional regulator